MKDLYTITKGGKDIITYYYPHIHEFFDSKKHFSLRNESCPSCSIRKYNGIYYITDFGESSKAMSPIDLAMREENKSFEETIKILKERYHIYKEAEKNLEIRDKRAEDIEGSFNFETEELKKEDCKIFGRYVTEESLINYGWKKVTFYTKVTSNKVIKKISTQNSPIFCRKCKIDQEDFFYKFYQPSEEKKEYRFFYYPIGKKPQNYINGLNELKELRQKYFESGEELPATVICCGERDAMNVAGFGHIPIWFNSETATVNSSDMREINNLSKVLYSIPDIDETGIRQGKKIALEYPNIKTIWLPKELSNKKDWRGNPLKDFRDWVAEGNNINNYKNLIRIARTAAYIEKKTNNDEEIKYHLNLVNLLYYLELNDFYNIQDNGGNSKIVHLENNKIIAYTCAMVKRWLVEDLKFKYAVQNEINLIISTNKINDFFLELLPPCPYSIVKPDEQKEIIPFLNGILEITKEDIKFSSKIPKNILFDEKSIINHFFYLKEKTFTFNCDNDKISVEINYTNSYFFRMAINTSRNHWATEMEKSGLSPLEFYKYRECNITATELTTEENDEQITSLINKLFVIGYLATKYKEASKPWAVYAMDNYKGDAFSSNGRSGKSLFFKLLEPMINTVIINGRQKKFTENNFLYDRVDLSTRIIKIDDIDKSIDLGYFYDDISGELYINKKRQNSFSIDFSESPKFVITSNYVPLNLDSSTEGRLLFCTFSDFYHIKGENNQYINDWTVYDHFKKNLIEEYTDSDFINDFNFIANCCQFYLNFKNKKRNPPMKYCQARRDDLLIGEDLEDWAEIFFAENGQLNQLTPKTDAFFDYKNYTNSTIKMNMFTKRIRRWCEKKGYSWNNHPSVNQVTGRIIQRSAVTKKTLEYIYISNK